MLKKLGFLLALAMVVNSTSVFAQDESTPVTGLTLSGEVRARGWISKVDGNGADLGGSDTKIVFTYKFSNYSGAVFGLNAGNGTPGVGDAYVYTDILREFGVQAVGLKLQLGKFGLKEAKYHPSVFQASDDSVTVHDHYNTDKFNALLELNVNRDIVPLVVRLGGDLDFGYMNQKTNDTLWSPSKGRGGFHALAEIDLDKMTLGDAVTLGVGVYTTVTNGDVKNGFILGVDPDGLDATHLFPSGTLKSKNPLIQVGGSVGIDVLNLPINLSIGASVNYYNFQDKNLKNEHDIVDLTVSTDPLNPGITPKYSKFNRNSGFGATVAATIGMDNKFDLGLGYRHQDAPKTFTGANKGIQDAVGIEFKLTMSEKVQPYAGFGVMVSSPYLPAFKAMNNGKLPNFSRIHQVEAGVDFIPAKNTVISFGYTRKGDLIQDNGTIRAMIAPDGWGGMYVRSAFKF